ncbi:hypothetical protein E5720_12735 [Rhodococcus sp. PAMC28707]|uniref:hypothetical protein n=1 Tax=unclassified Rhodococcus (in: high G+C Gram-positive bacteria) TaxID=192944 RepID=UPI00109DD580|nr:MULTISPECIES: hypothetical protein [unclassified Rhodococcus (in: high G+C Gram-positive bacteria)]QCB49079.1 hypothetical protein E5769_01280 [Rhodococcus sp. PAMC28705]QCB59233.1 hypothetical protein E5720_12735 [Rhodococcus sp. PAMC28707]
MITSTRRTVERKGGAPALPSLRRETLSEGRAGKHHEVCLSDVRRTAPDKLKTLLRQPVAQACFASPSEKLTPIQ